MQITDAMLRAAANIFCEAGLPIHLPQDGDLDDVERERYETLRAALSAALAAAQNGGDLPAPPMARSSAS